MIYFQWCLTCLWTSLKYLCFRQIFSIEIDSVYSYSFPSKIQLCQYVLNRWETNTLLKIVYNLQVLLFCIGNQIDVSLIFVHLVWWKIFLFCWCSIEVLCWSSIGFLCDTIGLIDTVLMKWCFYLLTEKRLFFICYNKVFFSNWIWNVFALQSVVKDIDSDRDTFLVILATICTLTRFKMFKRVAHVSFGHCTFPLDRFNVQFDNILVKTTVKLWHPANKKIRWIWKQGRFKYLFTFESS